MDESLFKESRKDKDSFKDKLYTIDDRGNRKWVYPEVVWGKFLKIRTVVAFGLMFVYLFAPWIRISGRPLILLNLWERKFTFFGFDFWATDTIFFMFFLTSMGLVLFLVTSVMGRVWCGWACPETVFLEFLFRPIERLIEGNATQRKRLDESPWGVNKITKKALKHGISAILASVIANTALAYFIGTERLVEVMTHSPFQNPVLFSVMLILMFAMAFQFGWFREQFCTVLCPYARFQSVMLDTDSLVIGYDTVRGEPRGKKGSTIGDCIDCKACVRVCPTGIDIRNGLQLECINCSQCIDACDQIMKKISRPPGLIRYDTERKLLGGERKFLRPRLFVYIFILIAYLFAFAYFIGIRTGYDFDIVREARTGLFSEASSSELMNQFKLRISNKLDSDSVFVISLEDESSFSVSPRLILPVSEIKVEAGKIFDVPLFVRFDKSLVSKIGKREISIQATSHSGEVLRKQITLIGPKE